MTRDGIGTKLLAALFTAALAAALLSACGGSDSGSDSTAAGASTSTSPAEAKAKLEEKTKELKKKREEEGKSTAEPEKKSGGESGGSGGGSKKDVATPLKVSGGGSGQFRTKGGDNSIQNYGEEGDESELQEVAEIVHSFYVARAEERWAEACSYLAKSNVEQLEQLASQSPQFKGKGCPEILKAFTRPLPPKVNREVTTVDAGSFRHDNEQGFLIYYGAEKTVYAMPLRNEDGTWQVAALAGSAIG